MVTTNIFLDGSINIQNPASSLSDIERLGLTESLGALKHDIEQHLPYFVFVERDRNSTNKDKYAVTGNIAFCGKDKAPLTLQTELGFYGIEPLRVTDLVGYLKSTMPMENEDNSGWIIPLYEGNDFASEQELNAYMHNLMYWESMLPATMSGPLTLRYGCALCEAYRLLKDSCETSIQKARDEELQEQLRANTKKERKRKELEMRMTELQQRIALNEKQIQTAQIEQSRRTQMLDTIRREQEEMTLTQCRLQQEKEQLEEEMKQLIELTNGQ